MAHRVARRFVPEEVSRAARISFEHEAPPYRESYTQAFGCAVHFGQAYNGSLFCRSSLDVPQLHADPISLMALQRAADSLLSAGPPRAAVSERVRDILRFGSAPSEVTCEGIAQSLGITARSLRRRLATEGLTLSGLLDEERCRFACAELKRDASVKVLSERLGFSEPSAFHRAFKRWTGTTPVRYQRG